MEHYDLLALLAAGVAPMQVDRPYRTDPATALIAIWLAKQVIGAAFAVRIRELVLSGIWVMGGRVVLLAAVLTLWNRS